MKIDHKAQGIEGTLTTDYSKHFNKSWLECDDIKKLLQSDYMSNLNFYMNESYLGNFNTYPRIKANLFRPFNLTALNDVRVVLMCDEPFTNVYSNGLAFGQMVSSTALKPKEVIALRMAAEKTYFDKENIVFDSTLEEWARQGVLLLNASLISEIASPNKHSKAFRNFTRQIIKIVDRELADVVFVFTNKKQEETFGKYINQEHNHMITVDGITPNCGLFDEINNILIEAEGKDNVINWV